MGLSGHLTGGSPAACLHAQRSTGKVAFAAQSTNGQLHAQKRRTSHFISCRLSKTRAQRQTCLVVRAEGEWNPPTVSDTKAKFFEGFRKPLPAVYNVVVQELLVQQHLIRYNKKYQYDEVLDGLPESGDTSRIFGAYVSALDEDASKYREDHDRLAAQAKELTKSSELTPDESGNEIQKLLAGIANRAKENDFLYSKFFAIGLFRLLELTGAKDPQALGSLVKAMNIRQEGVNRDLMTYKGVLSKLSAAKELMRDFIEREKRKQAERDAERNEKSKAVKDTPESQVAQDPEKAQV